jgi:N-methylhydantoinase A/oxoprolinase/acetone carboxylase beta subunit
VALDRLTVLEAEARAELVAQGFISTGISCTCYLNCRYQGTDTAMMTSLDMSSIDRAFELGMKRAEGKDSPPFSNLSSISGMLILYLYLSLLVC